MRLFYNPRLDSASKTIAFDKTESKHIVKVLRKVVNDNIQITNGKGFLFNAKIISANPNKCSAEILDYDFQAPLPYHLHLAVAPTKMNERFAWFLEKATEIGIAQITPVICDHSERKTLKYKRFSRILESAMKQSLHYYLPTLENPMPFSKFIKNDFGDQRFIAHCQDTEKVYLKDELRPKKPVTILIGPEGGFSTQEIGKALKHNFKPIGLGPSRLRTETAAIVCCHTVALANL